MDNQIPYLALYQALVYMDEQRSESQDGDSEGESHGYDGWNALKWVIFGTARWMLKPRVENSQYQDVRVPNVE